MARKTGYEKLSKLLHEAHKEVMRLLRKHRKSKELKMLRGAILAAMEWLENRIADEG